MRDADVRSSLFCSCSFLSPAAIRRDRRGRFNRDYNRGHGRVGERTYISAVTSLSGARGGYPEMFLSAVQQERIGRIEERSRVRGFGTGFCNERHI